MLEKLVELVRPVDVKGKDNARVRDEWVSKKYKLRFYGALVFAVLFIIGFQISGFESNLFKGLSDKSVVFQKVIEMFNDKVLSFFGGSVDKDIFSSVYEAFIFLMVLAFSYALISSNDPLSDGSYMRKLVVEKPDSYFGRVFLFIFGEVYFYSMNSPSNKIYERCRTCDAYSCSNKIYIDSEFRNSRWNKMFPRLSVERVNSLLKVSHKCRLVFVIRFVLFMSGGFVVFTYLMSKVYESFFGTFSFDFSVFYYVAILWGAGFAVGLIHRANLKEPTGVWFKFKSAVDDLFESTHFERVFDEAVCKHRDKDNQYTEMVKAYGSKITENGRSITRLLAYIEFINKIKMKESDRFLCEGNSSHTDVDRLREIVEGICGALEVFGLNKNRIRAALYIPDDRVDMLVPVASIPYDDKEFVSLQCHQTQKNNMSINSDSVAVDAWLSGNPVSASGNQMKYFNESQKQHLKSMIAIPILASDKVMNYFKEIGAEIPRVLGVLTVDSRSENDFVEEAKGDHLRIMQMGILCLQECILLAVKEKRG